MDSPHDKTPFSVSDSPPGREPKNSPDAEETAFPVRTDRLYQIAAVAAGIIFLATVL